MQGRLENEMKLQKITEDMTKELPSFVNEWYINMKASRKTASTCHDYVAKIKKFCEYLNEKPSDVRIEDITIQSCESYLISCQTKKKDNGMIVCTSDSYQQTVWHALSSLLTYLKKRNYIEYNYMQDIDKPKNRDLDRINEERILLTQKDFQKILRCAKQPRGFMNGLLTNRDVLILLIFMTTGVRKTALKEINIEDININDKILKVIDKGNKTHLYSLSDQIISYLQNWIEDRKQLSTDKSGDALFISRNGERMSNDAIYKMVKKYCKEAIGKELSPHKLRAGFCSILYNKTHDAEFVRRAVGHSNIQTTQRYIKTDGKEKEKASQIMSNLIN